jgi:cation diffusion facilitator CzcD-associated flavoprotein CzcO
MESLVSLIRGVSLVALKLMPISSYSPAPEILQYFRTVAQKYELYKYINLSHKVIGATWDEEKGVWNLEAEDLTTGKIIKDWCHFLINGSGVLKLVSDSKQDIENANNYCQ